MTTTPPLVSQPIDVTADEHITGTVEGEYIALDYPGLPWRADVSAGMAANGTIYAAVYARIFSSANGGRDWSSAAIDARRLEPPLAAKDAGYDSFGVCRDGTLLWAYAVDDDNYLIRSSDGGHTWSPACRLDKSPFSSAGGNQNGIAQLADGTLLWPTRMGIEHELVRTTIARGPEQAYHGPPFWGTHVFRSSDGGMTWLTRSEMQVWGVETNLLELRSGSLLAAIRYQRWGGAEPPPNEPAELVASDDPGDKAFPGKRVFLADSRDCGLTWRNLRPVSLSPDGRSELPHGDAHGHLVQVSDGRVVLVHDHRYPYQEGAVWARVSEDDGRTWRPEVYHLSSGHGYGASVVLPDDTIVTVCGNTPLGETGQPEPGTEWTVQAVRWQLQ